MNLWDWWKSLLLQGAPSAPSARRLDGRSKTLLAASIKALPYETPGWITNKAAANSAALVCGTGIVSLKRTMRTGLAFCTYLPMVFPIAFSGKNQDPNIARGAKVVAVGANAVPPTPHPNGFAPQSPGAAGAFF